MLAATLAALTLGAAQAATLDWQENGAYNNKDIVAGTGYDHPFAYTVAINVTGTVAADGTDLVKFGYWNGDAFLKVNTNSELRYQAGNWSPSATRPALTTVLTSSPSTTPLGIVAASMWRFTWMGRSMPRSTKAVTRLA